MNSNAVTGEIGKEAPIELPVANDAITPATESKHTDADTGPDASTSDPTDGRDKNDWQSKYPLAAKQQIRQECWYVFLLTFISLLLIFSTWRNFIGEALGLSGSELLEFRKYSYYSFAGLLGGTVYGMKYLYRVVARGYWHEDRKPWRYMSPYIALAISFAFGAMIDGKFVTMPHQVNGSVIVGIGFLVGYFADRAIGKLHDIADVVFGHSSQKK